MPTDPTPAGTVRHPGGCLQPVLLRGRVDHIDGATGELLHRYTTIHEPGGVLPIACKTRRASRCPPCAETYRTDTYQLIRAHDLRHIHATTLLLSGVPVHVVAARLGHADPAITLQVYAHVIRTAEAAAADIFAQAVRAA